MVNLKKDLFLVTGAAGFVGGHLLDYLLKHGVRIRAMARSESQVSELKERGIEVVRADLRDKPSLDRAVSGVSGIFHIASLFRKAGLPDSEFFNSNADGTRRLLETAVSAGVSRFVHCSTIGVHGHIENPPANENAPFSPGDIYQESKLAGERIAREFFKSGSISGVVIRPAMVWGPGDLRTLKLFSMIARERFFYIGRGAGLVHFIDVRDLARAFAAAMQAVDLNDRSYIIAGRESLTLRELSERVAEQLGVRPPWLCLPVKPMQLLGTFCEKLCAPLGIEPPIFRRRVDFFTKDRCFDCANARLDLGFEPAQELEGEIADIIRWYRQDGCLPPSGASQPREISTISPVKRAVGS
ncbi:MAG: NAD-dependent epimerase/dehydratase family protein [Bdellovibrionales bacterium]|nr:NAD-dependent epimerase/dehydratase family protein [Bdellovibrionales bacterium]